MSAPLSIPAETFLLFTNDKGRQQSTQFRRHAVAAAAVIELLLRDRVQLTEGRNPTLTVRDTTPIGEPTLDTALAALADREGARLGSVLRHRSMDLTQVVGGDLASRGILERKAGFFGTTWPVRDSGPERALRDRLAAALRWASGDAADESADTTAAGAGTTAAQSSTTAAQSSATAPGRADGPGSGPSVQDVILLTLLKAAQAGWVIIKDDVPEMRRGEVLAAIDRLGTQSPAAPVVTRLKKEIEAMMATITTASIS